MTVSCEKLGRGAREALAGCNVKYLSRIQRSLLPAVVRSRITARRVSDFRRKSDGIIIDHGQTINDAELSYVHNFLAPEFASRVPGYLAEQAQNGKYWDNISDSSTIIANSEMVKQGLIRRSMAPDEAIEVIYPGYDAKRFCPERRDKLRTHSRQQLGVANDEPLIGLITSGQFEKRGLQVFLDCLDELRSRHPGLRALVLGGRREPSLLAAHPARRSGQIIYQPTTPQPDEYFAALDVFLYPARYEEFGVVVIEAMAMGIPIVTSTAVGASELVAMADRETVISASSDSVSTLCRQVTRVLQMEEGQRAELRDALMDIARLYASDVHNSTVYALLKKRGLT